MLPRQGPAKISEAQLFNLAADTGEKNNLADKEPGKVKKLEAAWKKLDAELEEPRWIPNRNRRTQSAR